MPSTHEIHTRGIQIAAQRLMMRPFSGGDRREANAYMPDGRRARILSRTVVTPTSTTSFDWPNDDLDFEVFVGVFLDESDLSLVRLIEVPVSEVLRLGHRTTNFRFRWSGKMRREPGVRIHFEV